MNQSQELLVKDDEVTLLDLAPAAQGHLAPGEHTPGLDRMHQESLLCEAVAHLSFRVTMLDLLHRAAPVIGHFDYKFCHSFSLKPTLP